jgi:hypothetical protein
MCGAPSMPTPSAPPAPIPQRDTAIDGTRQRQDASRRASQTGYTSTMLTGKGGDSTPGAGTSPVLGG